MVFLIIAPNEHSKARPDEPAGAHHAGHDHHHDANPEPWTIRGPIVVLSLLAIGAGYLGDRIGALIGVEHIHHPSVAEMAPAAILALAGVALAWFEFGRKGSSQLGFVARVPAALRLFRNRWYIDEIYNATIVRASVGLARLCFVTETRGFDGAADGVAEGTAELGDAVARSHSGRLQLYVGVAGAVVGAAALYLGMR
jgi:NADH-quinone oxidoreductase subunit L